MVSRHILTSIAVAQAAIWGFGVYFEHSRGGLRFLDRIESATIDIRTLARGKRVPPDLVTIVAIDDDVVKQRGAYPLLRIDLVRGALGIGAAGLAIVEALVVSPHIERLHLEGAIRGLGIAGLELDSVHHTAEALAKTELTLLVVILVLHAFRPRAEPG